MSRIDKWLAEEPRRTRAEIACLLARDRFWKDERLRLIGTHPEWPDAAHVLLDLADEMAHAFVLVLSQLPAASRRAFADLYYERRRGTGGVPDDARSRLAVAAAVVLKVVAIIDDPAICNERTLDLLRGAAQRDDLTRTPQLAVQELQKTIARIRFDLAFEDPADPRGAAALALTEVLVPSSELVDFKEVLARSAWAAVASWEPDRVLDFLLDVDRMLADE